MEDKILELLGDSILIVDRRGRVIDVNEKFTLLFGYHKEEIIGEKFDVLMPSRFREKHGNLFRGFQKAPETRPMGKSHERQFVGVDKKGKEFFIDISLSNYTSEADSEMYFVAVIRDITLLINLQNELKLSNNNFIQKNKELEQLAYILSHDLKAPTSTCRQLIELIDVRYRDELSTEVWSLFETIKAGNIRMAELIDGILSYATAGKGAQDKEMIGLSDLIEDVVENLNIYDGFRVVYSSGPIVFRGHRTQIHQVLQNLIDNAIKYHDQSQGIVEISGLKTQGELEIRVKDDGPGIPEKYHQSVFEMFESANQEERSDSSGIGLAIVKKIIHLNEGAIFINPQVKKGTEFIFTIKT